jgi:hypothetical protein
MTTGLLITTAGQAAIAADLAGGADLVLSHVAFGDSNGVPYAPNEAQVALVNERYRATIASVAVVAGAIVVDAVIPADTPDGSARPSHGFSIAEAGLYSAAGTLIGLARMSNGYKPPPSSGQAAIATYRFKLPVANPSAITVVIDPQAQVQLGRNVRPFWMTVDGVLNAPPSAPVVGATYVIGAAPTGAWAGFANRLAQWVGVWALASVPEGHLVSDPSTARYLKRTAAGWESAANTETEYGFSRLATAADIAAGTSGVSVGADKLRSGVSKLPIHAEVKTADRRFSIAAAGGNVVITGAMVLWRGWNEFDLTAITAPNRTFATAASKTYHLRWDAPGTGQATPAATYPNGRFTLWDLANPTALASGNVAFDTTYDSLLIAVVTTNGANVATVTALANSSRLSISHATSIGNGSSLSGNYGSSYTGTIQLNWGRSPTEHSAGGAMDHSGGTDLEYANLVSVGTADRFGITATVVCNWNESMVSPAILSGRVWVSALAA